MFSYYPQHDPYSGIIDRNPVVIGSAEDLPEDEKLGIDDIKHYSSLVEEFNNLLLLSNSDADEVAPIRNRVSFRQAPVPEVRGVSLALVSDDSDVGSPSVPAIHQSASYPKAGADDQLWVASVTDPASSPTRPAPPLDSTQLNTYSSPSSSSHKRLVGIGFDLRKLPKVLSPIKDASPDDWYHRHVAKLQRVAEGMEADRLQSLKRKKESTMDGKGVSQFSYALSKAGSGVTASLDTRIVEFFEERERKLRKQHIKQAKARLAKYWPLHNPVSFIVEFDCFALHNRRPIRGHILLTSSSLLFIGKGKNELVIVEEILLSEIASYSKGVSVPCSSQKDARCVMEAAVDPLVVPDVIQFFTLRETRFDFLNVSQQILKPCANPITGTYVHDDHTEVTAYERFINYFDHAWRPLMPMQAEVWEPLDNAVTMPIGLL